MSIERKQGEILYLIYELHFPEKKDMWQDSQPIVHDIPHFLNNSFLRYNKKVCNDLIQRGEASWWTDHDIMGPSQHVLRIKKEPVPKRWGPGHGMAAGDKITKPLEERI